MIEASRFLLFYIINSGMIQQRGMIVRGDAEKVCAVISCLVSVMKQYVYRRSQYADVDADAVCSSKKKKKKKKTFISHILSLQMSMAELFGQ